MLFFGFGCLTVYLNFDLFFECNSVDEGARCLKSEAMSNDFVGIMIGNNSCDGGSGHSEVLQTYKRHKHTRSSS